MGPPGLGSTTASGLTMGVRCREVVAQVTEVALRIDQRPLKGQRDDHERDETSWR